jgi:4-diphosphocytidyl-2-C-methyl-D-erythritol kinase
MRLKLFAPAKVNLHLRVLGRRADGYHLLATVMQPVDLGDELSLASGPPGLAFTCDRQELARDNLAERAALAWCEAAGVEPAYEMHLAKRTPVAAGLGGGSSDAAAALMGLNALAGGLLPPARLVELAAGLGADVPFFLAGVTALCSGAGERVEPWPEFPLLDYVLVNPAIEVSTAWVYGQLDLAWTNPAVVNTIYRPSSGKNPLAGLLINDLEEVTIKAFPELDGIKRALLQEGALAAMMSGSGPTLFGVFADSAAARRAAARLQGRRGWWVRSCRGLAAPGRDA